MSLDRETAGTGGRQTDAELRAAIKKELDWCAEVDAAHVIVGVTDSIVELAGEVTSLVEVGYVERAVLRVKGVVAVANDISVRVPYKSAQPDRDIAKAIHDSIFWNSSVPRDCIKVSVSDRVATLTGQLDYVFQRQEAERVATRTVGVRKVVNRITLPHHPVAEDAAERIHDAFERSAAIDAQGIQVTVAGNEITLRGTVQSWVEKADAGRAAWSTPHATQVVNLIDVRP